MCFEDVVESGPILWAWTSSLPSSIRYNSQTKIARHKNIIGSRINFQDRKALFINSSPLVAMGAKVAMGAR